MSVKILSLCSSVKYTFSDRWPHTLHPTHAPAYCYSGGKEVRTHTEWGLLPRMVSHPDTGLWVFSVRKRPCVPVDQLENTTDYT